MPPPNPYARTVVTATAAREKENGRPQGSQVNNMGPQSQRRLTLNERTHHMQSQSHRKKVQQTLFGEQAFDPSKNCAKCRGGKASHKGHHEKCWNNPRKRNQSQAMTVEEKRLKLLYETPLTEAQKCSGKYLTRESTEAFFAPRENTTTATASAVTTTQFTNNNNNTAATTEIGGGIVRSVDLDLYTGVKNLVKDPNFLKLHASSRTPLAMLAFAQVVIDKIIRNKQIDSQKYFNGLTITVPTNHDNNLDPDPQYHSIVGQRFLYVDWHKMFGLEIPCGRCNRGGFLKNDRTNYSKNRALFPVYMIDTAPMWCMVMSMVCSCCKRRVNANDSEILCRLPAFVASTHPVDSKYAVGNKNSHVAKAAASVFDQVMTAYANGDLCSRLLYSAVNSAYLERESNYYSYFKEKNAGSNATIIPKPYIQKDGVFMKMFPPTGDTIRDLFDDTFNNANTPWRISDHDRHTREIQGVSCSITMAQDHTFDVLHNYQNQKKLGASALWDVATETGGIATAVLLPSTKTTHFSHAAKQLSRRPNFKPKVMYSDTYPSKSEYWPLIFKNVEGRLGLFHHIQRTTRTLRKNHVDYFEAITKLLDAVYSYHPEDYEAVIAALKKGYLGRKIHSDEDITSLRGTRLFRQRYGKYIRKIIRPANTMARLIDDWFVRFKVTASEGSWRAQGRLDPRTHLTLFKPETRNAVDECKKKSQYLSDPLPIGDMYLTVPANPNSQHQLPQHMSRSVESKLESFHDNLSHFANCGMRSSLCNNLNLCGTARYNLAIRHKLTLKNTQREAGSRKHMPAAWEDVIPYYNHTELQHVNDIARQAGANQMPFANLEPLPQDNGERFFSECIVQVNPINQRYDSLD